ncbi:uncharacterized protein LOC120899968 isoform X4 [Anopheles arabiensis]|uniref:uncharacterized protein LOC120899968 isoform X4 n=1 Tax=Anopheles arabiensis TaxID=7173 RepID=UPI001AACFD8E|nr:uncharacterized protein LOC120899968 isoform X4 [Anopheles arabiensis]
MSLARKHAEQWILRVQQQQLVLRIVIREQYWTWSCRCRRELTPREKALLIVIFILVLVIGGLATYLGIVVDSDDGITGGILTRSMLEPATTHQ